MKKIFFVDRRVLAPNVHVFSVFEAERDERPTQSSPSFRIIDANAVVGDLFIFVYATYKRSERQFVKTDFYRPDLSVKACSAAYFHKLVALLDFQLGIAVRFYIVAPYHVLGNVSAVSRTVFGHGVNVFKAYDFRRYEIVDFAVFVADFYFSIVKRIA